MSEDPVTPPTDSFDEGPKIPPSVPLQSAEAARIEATAQSEIEGIEGTAQSILAHVRMLEASFLGAVASVGTSPELERAKTLMMEARQWVVTHFTT